MTSFAFRRDIITKPIFSWARTVLPPMSDTEREALEAGDVWWDADLFTGNPDWSKLLATTPATLTAEEQKFLNGPVDALCAMLDDWKINWELRDLPPEVWAVALIPTHLPGVEIGRRHLPAMQVFQNGPNWGRDVFIPLDYIIGGEARLGQGWKMLMTALAAGRGISLPSLSAAGAAFA